MLLLGHAAVSARRGPRGTCQETRAALWAPAECGVTARSASDGVDVNGIRVHHRRLQYRRYQCGMFRRETPSRPRIPCVYGLEVGSRRRTWLMGIRVPFAVSRFARKTRYFGANGERGCCVNLSRAYFWSVSPPEITLGILARKSTGATLAIAVSGRGGIPHWW